MRYLILNAISESAHCQKAKIIVRYFEKKKRTPSSSCLKNLLFLATFKFCLFGHICPENETLSGNSLIRNTDLLKGALYLIVRGTIMTNVGEDCMRWDSNPRCEAEDATKLLT